MWFEWNICTLLDTKMIMDGIVCKTYTSKPIFKSLCFQDPKTIVVNINDQNTKFSVFSWKWCRV